MLEKENSYHLGEALRNTLDREFEDYVATRSLPAPDDPRGLERYAASLRRMALSSPDVGVRMGGSSGAPDTADRPATFDYHTRDLTSLARAKLTISSMLPIHQLCSGLYDFYPPELPVRAFCNRKPFTTPFTHQKESPTNSTILLSVPQVGSGRFYSSASTFQTPVDRYAHAWCGTVLPIDPALHDDAQGPKDVVVWAEGTITYDYALSATPGQAWNARPKAAFANVNVMARLLRFNRQTGALMADPDAILSYLAHSQILKASLVPNGVTTSLPSTPTPTVGGPYAAWSSGPASFAIDLPDGQTRKLETDSIYQVAVLCSVDLGALAAGQGPTAFVASAQVSAQLFLRQVTLGVFAHDPRVTF
ncbi:MAG: hypothetical protein EHM54_07550 [Nitrospiraceae bacterium]|nr:MAG: hypothetical protein EHM54_07550 [Nitrospiraceae bacterium]